MFLLTRQDCEIDKEIYQYKLEKKEFFADAAVQLFY